jgi:hypothetical protein
VALLRDVVDAAGSRPWAPNERSGSGSGDRLRLDFLWNGDSMLNVTRFLICEEISMACQRRRALRHD